MCIQYRKTSLQNLYLQYSYIIRRRQVLPTTKGHQWHIYSALSTQHLNFRWPDNRHTVVLARAVSYASGRIAVIRCIPLPPSSYIRKNAHTHTHIQTYIHAWNPLKPSFLKFDRIRNGARYLPTRISRTASLFGRIYRPWIIGSLRRMIGYTKFDSPHRLFFIPRSISAVRREKEYIWNFRKHRII